MTDLKHNLRADQVARLLDVPDQVRAEQSPHGLIEQLALLVAAAIEAKVALVSRRGASWVLLAESTPMPPLPAAGDPAWTRFDELTGEDRRTVALWHESSGCAWTLVIPRTPPVVFVMEGDWTPSRRVLEKFAARLAGAEPVETPVLRSPAPAAPQLAVACHRLARALSRVAGERDVCQTVLKHVVRVLPSRIGAFAVPDDDGRLAIVATLGYPLTIVEHLRIAPGVGVLGSVYQRRAPMRVSDVSTHPAIGHRRSRYRTDSFIAVPVVAGSDVLGVLALTDRLDGGIFTREDLSALRALVAPASLALARERQRRQAERYALSAAIDPVSGLYNRRHFESRLEEELQRGRRSGVPVALLMLDIDDFKSVNDRFGHVAGDTVIRDVADILRRSVRAFDVCTRYGGEEFAVLMPGSDPESAATTAERIRQRIEAYEPTEPEFAHIRVTASFGIAATAGGAANALVESADRALYAAKRSGKNQVRIDPEGIPPQSP
jgi:diguanylate cyclase (GGDEF)-like protein